MKYIFFRNFPQPSTLENYKNLKCLFSRNTWCGICQNQLNQFSWNFYDPSPVKFVQISKLNFLENMWFRIPYKKKNSPEPFLCISGLGHKKVTLRVSGEYFELWELFYWLSKLYFPKSEFWSLYGKYQEFHVRRTLEFSQKKPENVSKIKY